MFHFISKNKKIKILSQGACLAYSLVSSLYANQTEEIFTSIYDNKIWGSNEEGCGTSGNGSLLETTKEYRSFLQNFLTKFQIHSVVDMGCGDWQFSRTMNWDGISYIGYDVVRSVIENNQKKFSAPNIIFIHGDASCLDLPQADLLICKDVLQHLPHEDIIQILSQCYKFKYCLITNDVDPVTLSSLNDQITKGGYRTLDLSKPPFSLNGVKILNYQTNHGLIKEVFLLSNSSQPGLQSLLDFKGSKEYR